MRTGALVLAALLAACGTAGSSTGDDARHDAGLDAGHPSDAAVPPDASAADAAEPPDAATAEVDAGVPLNAGWIGGACTTAADCDVADATCETTGFPRGMCTAACTAGTSGLYVCPDRANALDTTTRCIDSVVDGPRCVSECDFSLSPTGCRDGYACVLRARYQQPSRIFPVCLPAETQSWPGEAAPAFDIGAACASASDCAHLACLPLPGGYCTKTLCAATGCPAGSTCATVGETTACVLDCASSSTCREAEGYACDADGACWSSTVAPGGWDSSVGAADCASAWSAGLSPCDATPDVYVVVNKHARNLAWCSAGTLVANYNVGLGVPEGDKQQEGDGKTPEGVFYVARRVDPSQYHLAFLLSYPDAADAERGVAAGLINAATRDAIVSAQAACTEPPQSTPLGGLVEIHGGGAGADWTLGCVALDNANIDALWAVLAVGDTIVVRP